MASTVGQQLMRMLVTRPEPDGELTQARLAALDIDAVAVPLMVRQTLDTSLPPPDGFTAMVLTSANAVRSLADRGVIGDYAHLPVFTVGDHTAREAQAAGFARVSSAAGAFQDLVNAMAIAELRGPVFYPAPRHQSADLAKALAPLGVMVATSKIYDMVAVDALPDHIINGLADDIAAVLLYSRRTAEIFCRLADALPRERRQQLALLCMSEAVAEPALAARFSRISLADHPDEEAMMALALAFAREQSGS